MQPLVDHIDRCGKKIEVDLDRSINLGIINITWKGMNCTETERSEKRKILIDSISLNSQGSDINFSFHMAETISTHSEKIDTHIYRLYAHPRPFNQLPIFAQVVCMLMIQEDAS